MRMIPSVKTNVNFVSILMFMCNFNANVSNQIAIFDLQYHMCAYVLIRIILITILSSDYM